MKNSLQAGILAALMPATLCAQMKSEAPEDPKERHSTLLSSYEPSRIGWTRDDDDVGFMDFKVSMKYPLLFDYINYCKEDGKCLWLPSIYSPYLYFAFSGRFGQYLGTRNSSPVIGKRFNPSLFLRWKDLEAGDRWYIDLIYAHESNGQAITSKDVFDTVAAREEQPRFAKDYVSRGWDYIALEGKLGTRIRPDKPGDLAHNVSGHLNVKGFLRKSFLQGSPEEHESWEGDSEGKRRNRVNGIQLGGRYELVRPNGVNIPVFCTGEYKCFKNGAIQLSYLFETGYVRPLEFRTHRIEFGIKPRTSPIVFWFSNGYNSDLAQYYKSVKSFGIALELKTFSEELLPAGPFEAPVPER